MVLFYHKILTEKHQFESTVKYLTVIELPKVMSHDNQENLTMWLTSTLTSSSSK